MAVEQLIEDEREQSHAYGGWTVFGWAAPPAPRELTDRLRRVAGKLPRSHGMPTGTVALALGVDLLRTATDDRVWPKAEWLLTVISREKRTL
jgi:hypothetical protein